jgi:uncharacterized DUF497 family protein
LLQPERQLASSRSARWEHIRKLSLRLEAHQVDGDHRDGHQDDLRHEDDDDRLVQVLLDLGHLGRCVAVVHLDLGLLAGVDGDAIAPISVREQRTAEHDVSGAQGDRLGRGIQLQRADEVVDVLVGRFKVE